uniref:Ead/Ea22-like family protein n=1 Tax=Serratia marcescens TaxID=615 RepID=A0A9X8VEI1_SERMA
MDNKLSELSKPVVLAELEAKDKRIAELEAKTAMTMGVGSGNGNLFVHGDYDSIKAAQAIVLENESLRAKLATPVRLPSEHELRQVACSECAGNCLELVEGTVRAAGFTVEDRQ